MRRETLYLTDIVQSVEAIHRFLHWVSQETFLALLASDAVNEESNPSTDSQNAS
ncbi:MAG: hypothetical protein FJY97_07665 [candidate division Zixibacteria bacterium]|nr:hypothetical protein [candidate division Zixibacteria bacterium]